MTVSAKDLILLPWDRQLALFHVSHPAGHPTLRLPWISDVPAVLTADGALVVVPETGLRRSAQPF